MTLQLTHKHDDFIDIGYGDQQLFRYVYKPDMPQAESPKPYFHPLYTLRGDLLTNYRPHDHLWHKGIQMTVAHLSGQNFWGGASYVKDEGYKQLPNNGGMWHQKWGQIHCDGKSVSLLETLVWRTQSGADWIAEDRTIAITELDVNVGYWCLDYLTNLTNIRNEDLIFGSPTTEGRPNAGYGGLFWRGPRSFTQGGQAWASTGVEGEEIRGTAASWLAYSGKHDGTGNRSTLLFLDHPQNLRYPNKWFVRINPFACASFAFMFDEEYTLEPEQTLPLRYRIVFVDGELSSEQIVELAEGWQ